MHPLSKGQGRVPHSQGLCLPRARTLKRDRAVLGTAWVSVCAGEPKGPWASLTGPQAWVEGLDHSPEAWGETGPVRTALF